MSSQIRAAVPVACRAACRAFTNTTANMGSRPQGEDSPFIFFPSRRSVVHSTQGIVSCTNPLAAQAGLRVLREGGNAADAAVATAAALNVVDPAMTGIGGDAFCLFYKADDKKVLALNGSGRSPANSTLEGVRKDLGVTDPAKAAIPRTSVHAVTIPGAAAAWVDTVEKFGSGKVSLGQVLAPAIELAERGFPVSQVSAYYWIMTEDELKTVSPWGFELLKEDPSAPGGYRAPREGEVVRNPLLASTFRLLAEGGKAGFYEGPVAEAIIKATQSKAGPHTLEDLKHHAEQGSEISDAISVKLGEAPRSEPPSAGSKNSVNGISLWEHPPNGQGIVALMALGILQELEKSGRTPKLSELGHNSARYLHAVVESLRLAFADASWFVCDPAASPVPPQALLSPEYLAERALRFSADKVTKDVDVHGSPALHASDTVYLATSDSEGNGCSFVNSLSDRFGSCIVPPGTGFALQNRGSGFRLDDAAHPNAFAPRKRAFNTIIPAIITDSANGSLRSVYGVMGGFMQPQGHVQVLLNMHAFGLNPQAALDAPRVCIGAPIPGKSLDPSKPIDMTVYLEEGIGDEVARELTALGHEVKVVQGEGRALFGRGQVINVSHDPVTGERVYSAGSDPRGDGHAVPL